MRLRLGAAVLVALAAAAPSAVAAPRRVEVNVQYQAFNPTPIDVLPGQTVTWSNVSQRTHTVTASDGSFGSGDIVGGGRFSRTFDAPGRYRYYCRIHQGMRGEIDVRRVSLDSLPPAAVPLGDRVEFSGATADARRPVRIELRRARGFGVVATTRPRRDGTWSVTVPATASGAYRARSGAAVSETRRLLVTDRRVHLRVTRTGVDVSVTPSDPYAQVMMQMDLRARFGWWPVARRRLDYVSEATFAVREPARVRVVLVAADGWTPLATSREVVIGAPASSSHRATMPGMHMG